MLEVKWNVVQNKFTEDKNINFTPNKANVTDRGYDVRAYALKKFWANPAEVEWDNEIIAPNETVYIGIGVSAVLPEKLITPLNNNTFEAIKPCNVFPSIQVKCRSGLGFKHNIEIFNGQIDNSYQNQIWVKFTNNGKDNFKLNFGDRIAQLIVELLPETNDDVNFVGSMDKLDNNNRSGFGSTGRK